LATGGFVDAEADPRSSPSRLFVPTRAMGERKRPTARHRIGTCSFAFTFEGDKIPVLIWGTVLCDTMVIFLESQTVNLAAPVTGILR